MTIDIMLDLETMGVGISPAIMEIAAVVFDPEGNTQDIEHHFHSGVTLASSVMSGLKITDSTIDFWRKQSDAAKQSMYSSQTTGNELLGVALEWFFEWIGELKAEFKDDDIRLWGNGILADNLWLYSACEAVGIDFSSNVSHWEHSDFRTLMETCEAVTGVNPKKELDFVGVQHNPVDDCIHQIKCVQAAFAELKK